jgi:hypothetical protein
LISYSYFIPSLELNNLVASTAYQLDLACILPVSQGPSSRRYRTLEQAQTLYSHTTFETVTNDARCQKLRVRFERSLIKEETQAFACMLAMRFAADPRL